MVHCVVLLELRLDKWQNPSVIIHSVNVLSCNFSSLRTALIDFK